MFISFFLFMNNIYFGGSKGFCDAVLKIKKIWLPKNIRRLPFTGLQIHE